MTIFSGLFLSPNISLYLLLSLHTQLSLLSRQLRRRSFNANFIRTELDPLSDRPDFADSLEANIEAARRTVVEPSKFHAIARVAQLKHRPYWEKELAEKYGVGLNKAVGFVCGVVGWFSRPSLSPVERDWAVKGVFIL